MNMTVLFAIIAGLGVLLAVYGLSRTPSTNTAQMVQQRLQVYGAGGPDKPLSIEEVELARPFSERFLRPAIERLGTLLSRSTPQKARQDLDNRLELAGRPPNLTPADFGAIRLVAAAVVGAIGLLLGILMASPIYMVVGLAAGAILGY